MPAAGAVARAAPRVMPKIKVDGAPLDAALAQKLVDFVIDDSLSLPDMIDLTFADNNAGFLEAAPFKIGAKVVVEL